MKKLSVLFTALMLAALVSNAQAPLGKGEKMFNFGLSYGAYIGLDYAIHDDITIGGQFDFGVNNGLGLTGHGDYHFNSLFGIEPNWDLYAGLRVGFWNQGLWGDGHIGMRYLWNDKWGVNLEFGGGFGGNGKLGLSMKF